MCQLCTGTAHDFTPEEWPPPSRCPRFKSGSDGKKCLFAGKGSIGGGTPVRTNNRRNCGICGRLRGPVRIAPTNLSLRFLFTVYVLERRGRRRRAGDVHVGSSTPVAKCNHYSHCREHPIRARLGGHCNDHATPDTLECLPSARKRRVTSYLGICSVSGKVESHPLRRPRRPNAVGLCAPHLDRAHRHNRRQRPSRTQGQPVETPRQLSRSPLTA